MKFTAEQMEKLIRAERKEAVKALNDAEKAYEADKISDFIKHLKKGLKIELMEV